jgi:hypothetical protein
MHYKMVAISNWLAEQSGMTTVMAQLCVLVVMLLYGLVTDVEAGL